MVNLANRTFALDSDDYSDVVLEKRMTSLPLKNTVTIIDTTTNNSHYNNTYSAKKVYPDEFGRPDEKQIRYAYSRQNSRYDFKEVKRILDYYFAKFFIICGYKHPVVCTSKMVDIITRLPMCVDKRGQPVEIDFLEYKDMIDYFFLSSR